MRQFGSLRYMTKVVATSAMLTLGIATSGNASPLIVNGGFETGDFTGWSATGNTQVGSFSGLSHTGNDYAWLGDTSGAGSLSQTVNDVAGQAYTLTYFFSSEYDNISTHTFSAQWNGATISGSFLTNPDTGSTHTNPNYAEYQFAVLGTGTDTLSFPYLDSYHAFLLDDVSLDAASSATPIPAALPLFATGLAGLGMMRLRRKKKKTAPISL